MKQAMHKFSGFLGPVHSVNFFFRRGKFLIRAKQIIGQHPIQQMIQWMDENIESLRQYSAESRVKKYSEVTD